MRLDKFIALCTDTVEKNSQGRHIHRSTFGCLMDIFRLIPDGFIEKVEWADCGLRRVFINAESFCVFTWCEGDVAISISPNEKTFNMELEEAEAFYATN